MNTFTALKGKSGTGKSHLIDALMRRYGAHEEARVEKFFGGADIGPCPIEHHYNKRGVHTYIDCLHLRAETSCRPTTIWRVDGTNTVTTGKGPGGKLTDGWDGKANNGGYLARARLLLDRGNAIVAWSRMPTSVLGQLKSLGYRVVVCEMVTPKAVIARQLELRNTLHENARPPVFNPDTDREIRASIRRAREACSHAFPLIWPADDAFIELCIGLGLVPAEPVLAAPQQPREHLLIGVCAYCGGPATERDHVIPKSRGGGEELGNVVAACRPCNGLKHQLTGDEFRSVFPLGVRSL